MENQVYIKGVVIMKKKILKCSRRLLVPLNPAYMLTSKCFRGKIYLFSRKMGLNNNRILESLTLHIFAK